jgi:hypothetical protein
MFDSSSPEAEPHTSTKIAPHTAEAIPTTLYTFTFSIPTRMDMVAAKTGIDGCMILYRVAEIYWRAIILPTTFVKEQHPKNRNLHLKNDIEW